MKTIYYVWNCDYNAFVRSWFMVEAYGKEEAANTVLAWQNNICSDGDQHVIENYKVYTYEELKKRFGENGVINFDN